MFRICARQDIFDISVSPKCSWLLTSSIVMSFNINGGCNGFPLLRENNIDLVFDSFMATNHCLDQDVIDWRSFHVILKGWVSAIKAGSFFHQTTQDVGETTLRNEDFVSFEFYPLKDRVYRLSSWKITVTSTDRSCWNPLTFLPFQRDHWREKQIRKPAA